MYTPSAFKITDDDLIWSFLLENSFGILITSTGAGMQATHLPFLLQRDPSQSLILRGHIAAANPQVQALDAHCEVLAMFSGPHGYISPGWYASPRDRSVPTWNYTAVHLYGKSRILSQPELVETLQATTDRMETGRPSPWSFEELDPDIAGALTNAITGFEIVVTRVEAKFKLSQNRSDADVEHACSGLLATRHASDIQLAELMARVNRDSRRSS